jgi:hypothetical protein
MSSDLEQALIEKTPPSLVFIVPYRDRIQHKFFFSKHMSFILEDETDYEIYFSHQCDTRSFNRGAAKNIGFLAIKNKYPDHYKQMTFIFNDVDTMPFHKLFNYRASPGIVNHYYGFRYTLGGIVAITGEDFEMINGFPNYWGWGMEDNVLQKRCQQYGLTINRNVFYPIGSQEILQLFDGISRIINRKDPWRATYDDGLNGLSTTYNIDFTIDAESSNPKDNVFIVDNDKIFYINILTFMTNIRYENDEYLTYDLREPKRRIVNPIKIASVNNAPQINNWSNKPYYSKENVTKVSVIKEETRKTKPQTAPQPRQPQPRQPQPRQPQPRQFTQPVNPQPKKQVNPYSREYAIINHIKPRATASANVRLGGVY